MRVSLSKRVQAAAQELSRFPGVIGVFWGHSRRRLRWREQQCLSVHVRWKRPTKDLRKSEKLPRSIDGIGVDVIEVGAPRTHALDVTDVARTPGARRSAVTAVSTSRNPALVLFCGHGILPMRQGSILRDYRPSDGSATIRIDDRDGGAYEGSIRRGRLGEGTSHDWALAEFDTLDAQPFHFIAGRATPLPLRRTALVAGEVVHQWSTARQRAVSGKFRQFQVTPFEMRLPDGTTTTYSGAMVVARNSGDFSVEGDSGSLLVDDGPSRRVLGMVLGASQSTALSYVLDVEPLLDVHDDFSRFFTR